MRIARRTTSAKRAFEIAGRVLDERAQSPNVGFSFFIDFTEQTWEYVVRSSTYSPRRHQHVLREIIHHGALSNVGILAVPRGEHRHGLYLHTSLSWNHSSMLERFVLIDCQSTHLIAGAISCMHPASFAHLLQP